MSEYQYCLCGIRLALSLPEGVRPTGPLEQFRAEDTADLPEVRYEARWYSGLPEPTGPVIDRHLGYRIRQSGRGFRYEFNVGYELNPYTLLLDQDPEGACNTLWLPEAHRELLLGEGLPAAQNLGQEILFLSRDRLLLHASLVRYRGRGILFTGPSGMGKSTQANLWQQVFGAEILNGDKAVIQLDGDGPLAWGSAYAGTSGIYRNESAKPVGILALRQGSRNEICPLRGRDALFELMPRMATAPWAGMWHSRGVDLALRLLEQVPVYRLTCRPDRGAAELAFETLFPQWAGILAGGKNREEEIE